jgi:glycerophosphoryl diester phosphodiesterase
MILDFLYIGHRGSRVNVDENTISAFKKALNYGANCIELDVRKTKNGKIVVLHDSTVDRTTNGSGILKNFTLEKLKELKTENQHSTIPTLIEIFDLLKGQIKFMIDVKETGLIKKLSKILREYNLLEDCIISGRNLTEILEFKKIHPQCKICYNITKGQGLSLKEFMNLSNDEKINLKLDFISLNSRLITNEFIEKCHINEIKALSWDFLNYKIDEIKGLVKLGLDGILFDNHNNIPQIKRWYNCL